MDMFQVRRIRTRRNVFPVMGAFYRIRVLQIIKKRRNDSTKVDDGIIYRLGGSNVPEFSRVAIRRCFPLGWVDLSAR